MSRKLKLNSAEIAAEIDQRHKEEADGWRKTRLLAVKLAAKGEYGAEQVAEWCGVVKSRVFAWVKCARERGIEALLTRGKPGPKEGTYRGVQREVIAELDAQLKAGRFANAEQARRWLKKEHEVERPYRTVCGWLKKAGGVLRVPRPSHSKKDPQAAGQFKNQLIEKFEALGIPCGSLVKVWFMDEARFGLHTEMRRVWTKKGLRPVFPRQIRYEWDYLYGAMSVVGGEAHFAHIPSVSLEWDQSYLQDLADTDPKAVHILVRDQAGFHLRDGDARLPERVRIIALPPYHPELNPCEQMWDIVKDDICNQVFANIEALRKSIGWTLQRFWDDAQSVIRLIGRHWFLLQLNAMPKIRESL